MTYNDINRGLNDSSILSLQKKSSYLNVFQQQLVIDNDIIDNKTQVLFNAFVDINLSRCKKRRFNA